MKNNPYIKPIVDLIVRNLMKLGGLKAMIASFIIKKLVEYGFKEGEKAVDKIQDNKTIKDEEKLASKPQTPEVIKQREENDRDLIEGN